jgi:hypothetical protein|nr:MAG TPA: hypothetical protein [Caudoviricetes sp.]
MKDCYMELANAIIVQAIVDYRNALVRLKVSPRDKKAEKQRIECESFFCSEWYRILTRLDCEILIQKLNREVYSI